MIQTKISIEEGQEKFISRYKALGFKDKSSLVRTAIDRFKREIEISQLKKSADLYAELYENDSELKELTESAIEGWPDE